MMKKALSIMLAAVLLLFTLGASAETFRFVESSSDFDITMALPEGATIASQEGVGELSIVTIAKEGLASVRITIAPTEAYDKESLADLPDEEVQGLADLATEQFENATTTIDVTKLGNKYIHVCANAESDVDSIVTVYKGYFIEMTQWHDDYSTITDADYAFMQELLFALEFTELK